MQSGSTEVSVVRRNARDWLGPVEHDNDAPVDDDGYASEDVSEVQNYDETPSGQLAMDYNFQIAVVRPRNFQDAATVGEYFRQEIPVIINLEDMDNAVSTRIIDFVSGLILGLGGDIEKLSRRAFLIVPADASILTAHDGLTKEGFFNQALRVAAKAAARPARPPSCRWRAWCQSRPRSGRRHIPAALRRGERLVGIPVEILVIVEDEGPAVFSGYRVYRDRQQAAGSADLPGGDNVKAALLVGSLRLQ
jgi:cell division inhibitor SepF